MAQHLTQQGLLLCTLRHVGVCCVFIFGLRVSTLRMTLVHTFGPFPSPGAAMVQHWVQQPSIRSKDFPARSNLMQFFCRGDDKPQILMPGAPDEYSGEEVSQK